jgi:hypothetical protein
MTTPPVCRQDWTAAVWVGTESVSPRHDPAQATEPEEAADTTEGSNPSPAQLREYLQCWRLPGGRLAPNQLRALLAWSDTPEEERAGLTASLALTHQQVPARSLAPNQRRGHVSWLERLKGVFRP